MNKLVRIIRSKFKDKSKIKEDWYFKRLELCGSCMYNSKNVKRYNPENTKGLKFIFWKIANLWKDFCTICGCEIKAKTSEELEICSLIEINKKPKWNQE